MIKYTVITKIKMNKKKDFTFYRIHFNYIYSNKYVQQQYITLKLKIKEHYDYSTTDYRSTTMNDDYGCLKQVGDDG